MKIEDYAQGYLPEDAALSAARTRAGELGVEPITPLGGAALQLLATLVGAKAAVEVGTGVGVSSLWLVRGMAPGAILTSIDSESEHQRLARQVLGDAEIQASRVRLIVGRGEDVVPRLSEAAYDLVHLDVPVGTALDLLPQALRVLRPGGVLAVSRTMAAGRIGDETARDGDAVAARALTRAVRDDPALTPLLFPIGAEDGMLLAVRSAD